ncbi:hypothetical protein WJX84_002058 [Apatococcus fuscideae]|uniref:Uncharacterized protein n=1 Tax=Apatococcus fuscideae TaxID=2026836 RepID=A0AAW1T5W6_9CHLO
MKASNQENQAQNCQTVWTPQPKAQKPTALTKHKSFLNRFQKGLRSIKKSTEDQTRAATSAAERLRSFAGGLRSAILRDDGNVEDKWGPASRSKHLRSLRAASLPFQEGSPTFSSAENGQSIGSSQL